MASQIYAGLDGIARKLTPGPSADAPYETPGGADDRLPPSLAEARTRTIEFGKFHGHTLGQIAEFEPTYIDWLARTISRDPDLVAAARAVQADLDERGILRQPRPATT